MSIEGGEGDGASEVCLFPLGNWVLLLVQVLLCQSEVNNEHLLVITGQHEVGSFDVSVDEASIVHLLDSVKHFN